ncbi:MAG TPA: hypothetical protein VGR50_00585 [Terriglobales bacterium]|nr:hypothetical protein [Terriglobales bacterium]
MAVFEFPNPSGVRRVPRIRLEQWPFFADIIMDRRSDPVMYIVIVQQHGSPLVRGISQHASMDEAQKSAKEDLEKLAARVA